MRSLRVLTPLTVAAIGAHAGISLRSVLRTPATWTPAVRVIARVAGDPRFPGLESGDLRYLKTWSRYRTRL